MSAPAKEGPRPAGKEPYVELAEKIYIGLATRVYGTLAGTEQKKPDPKALAAFSFRLANAFEQASKETDRAKAAEAVASKARVTLDDVDLSSVFAETKKP
jgi:hypothetical protein